MAAVIAAGAARVGGDRGWRAGGAGGAGSAARQLALLLAVLAALVGGDATAHELRPGVVAFTEHTPGEWAVRVTPAADGTGVAVGLRVSFPAECAYAGAALRCTTPLAGRIRVDGLRDARVAAVVIVHRLDGTRFAGVATGGAPEVAVPLPESGTHDAAGAGVEVGDGEAETDGSGADGPTSASALGVPAAVRWGFAHALGGLDHVLFVVCLSLIAGSVRRTVVAVTGFTVAHSVTLVAGAAGWVRPPGASTELVIALSVLLLATEAARGGATATRRAPGVVALLFGLVHGFGYAGEFRALDTGASFVGVLAGFNVGVELAQLVVVAAALAAGAAERRAGVVARTWERATAYVAGGVAAAWAWERGAAWAAGLG